MVVHILKMCTSHLDFSAHLITIRSFSTGVDIKHFMLRWCLACVICNSKSFHSLIFKLDIMIVHTCASSFCANFRAVELRHFFHQKCLGVVWYV